MKTAQDLDIARPDKWKLEMWHNLSKAVKDSDQKSRWWTLAEQNSMFKAVEGLIREIHYNQVKVEETSGNYIYPNKVLS